MPDLVHYQDNAEIADVVRKFEACEYPKENFTHPLHLTVAAWYVFHHPSEEALDAMRAALQRFAGHHGVTAYNETITRFWIALVEQVRNQGAEDQALTALANEVVKRFASKEILFDYYSRERVMSPEAKAAWIEPDLRPL